eukprot:12475768-Alexandrium_andersonii.AAC.1
MPNLPTERAAGRAGGASRGGWGVRRGGALCYAMGYRSNQIDRLHRTRQRPNRRPIEGARACADATKHVHVHAYAHSLAPTN